MKQQHTLQPKLRFPEFEGDWIKFKFKELYEFKSTNSLSRDKLNYENHNVKNIHYGDIHVKFKTLFDITKEDVPYVNEEIDLSKVSEDSYLKEGDVIIADASENYDDIGKAIEIINLNNEKVISGLHTFLARKISDLNYNGFISYVFRTKIYRHQIYKIAQGTKVLSLSSNRVANLNLNIPSLPEQQKIADYLSTIDNKINLLEEKKAQLALYKKAMMQKLFSQEIRFKDNNGNDFPEWEEKRLEDVFTVTRGQVLAVSKMKINSDNIFKYPVYSSQTRDNGLTGFYDEYLYQDAITWTTDGANAGTVLFRRGKFYCTNVCGVLISNEGNSNNCIAEMINMIAKKYVSYVGNPKLMNNVMAKIKIYFPSVQEQQKIADFLSAIDESIEKVNEQITQTQSFKKAMLQQMFV